MFDTIQSNLTASLTTSGTVTLSYPTGRDSGAYQGATGHVALLNGDKLSWPSDFSLTFGTSSITFTYLGSNTYAVGQTITVQVERQGERDGLPPRTVANDDKMAFANPVLINLGAPDAADADGVCASQAGTASTAMTINGALASGGVATFDVPRNVVAAWTNTATLTVTGTDEYGVAVVETSGSGTSMAGKKAFKTITSVVPSANITGATVGTGDVLGLPVFLPAVAQVFRELQDGAAATAGTVVAGVSTIPSATTGDVRGTYDPNAACDGAKAFQLAAILPDPTYKGLTQYSA